MSLEQAIERLTEEVINLRKTLEDVSAKPVEEEEEETPPKPTTTKKTTKKKASKKKAAKKADSHPKHSQDDIRDFAIRISDEGAKECVVDALARLGCRKLSDLDEAKYDEFYSRLEDLYADWQEDQEDEEEEDEGDMFD